MIASPLRPRERQESGIAAAGRLAHRGTPYGASLSFATTTHLWPLPDPPSRKLRSATSRTGAARSIPGRALASSVLDSPYQGSRTGLPPPISTSVPSTPATPSRYARRLRDDGRASPEPPLLSGGRSDPTARAATFLRDPYPPPTLTRGGPTNGVRSVEAAFTNGLSNARVEQINTQIRLIIRRGFGYHSPDAVIALAMLSLGGLCPPLPGR